jgi:hypothetical protein
MELFGSAAAPQLYSMVTAPSKDRTVGYLFMARTAPCPRCLSFRTQVPGNAAASLLAIP